jgi:hypothetical protein
VGLSEACALARQREDELGAAKHRSGAWLHWLHRCTLAAACCALRCPRRVACFSILRAAAGEAARMHAHGSFFDELQVPTEHPNPKP